MAESDKATEMTLNLSLSMGKEYADSRSYANNGVNEVEGHFQCRVECVTYKDWTSKLDLSSD